MSLHCGAGSFFHIEKLVPGVKQKKFPIWLGQFGNKQKNTINFSEYLIKQYTYIGNCETIDLY